jgi:hypothetical protein
LLLQVLLRMMWVRLMRASLQRHLQQREGHRRVRAMSSTAT